MASEQVTNDFAVTVTPRLPLLPSKSLFMGPRKVRWGIERPALKTALSESDFVL